MKKKYIAPVLDVITLVSTEIIVTSRLGISNNSSDSGPQYGKHRDPIWDDEE